MARAVLMSQSEGGFDGLRQRMKAPEWVDIKAGLTVPEDDLTYKLDEHNFKNLVSAYAEVAWELGWRPEGFTQSDTSQQGRHLEDMRTLAFHALKVPK